LLAAALKTLFTHTHASRNLELHDTGIERHIALGLAFRYVGGTTGHGIRSADTHGKQKETQLFKHKYSFVEMKDGRTDKVTQPAWPVDWQAGILYFMLVWSAAVIAQLMSPGAASWRVRLIYHALIQFVVTLRIAFRLPAGDRIRYADTHGKQKETQLFKHRYSFVEMADDDGPPWRAVPYASSLN
jgi:hypothetical protein